MRKLAEFIRFFKWIRPARFMVRIRLSPPRTKSLTGLNFLTFRRGEFRRIFRDLVAWVSRSRSGRRRFLPHSDLRGAVRLVFARHVVRVRGLQNKTQNSRLESQTGSRETGKVLQPPTLGQFYTDKAEQRVMVSVYNQPSISLT